MSMEILLVTEETNSVMIAGLLYKQRTGDSDWTEQTMRSVGGTASLLKVRGQFSFQTFSLAGIQASSTTLSSTVELETAPLCMLDKHCNP